MSIVTLTRGGMITIPAEIRRKYRLKEGSKIYVVDTPDGIKIIPFISLEDLAGTMDPDTADKICKEIQEERRKEAAKD